MSKKCEDCKCEKTKVLPIERDQFVAMYLAGRGLNWMQTRSYRSCLDAANGAYDEYLCVLDRG